MALTYSEQAYNSYPAEILNNLAELDIRHHGFTIGIRLGKIIVAKQLAKDVLSFFDLAYDLRFPIKEVALAEKYDNDDKRLMTANVTSGFNYRLIADTDKLSMHATGMAIDVNPMQNPYIRYKGDEIIHEPENSKWDPTAPGTLHPDHPLVEHMKILGWEWGGDWSAASGRIDYQHFQKSA